MLWTTATHKFTYNRRHLQCGYPTITERFLPSIKTQWPKTSQTSSHTPKHLHTKIA